LYKHAQGEDSVPRVNKKGASIHYRGEGDGPTLVLAHSYTNRSETWYERGYVAALKPKYRLVLIDARGVTPQLRERLLKNVQPP